MYAGGAGGARERAIMARPFDQAVRPMADTASRGHEPGMTDKRKAYPEVGLTRFR
jgi:hypothetical protein